MPIESFPIPNGTKAIFLGWFNKRNKCITTEFIVNTTEKHTFYVYWLEVTQSQVEIVFSTEDMDKEEIEEVIKKHTDADFAITMIESFEDGMWVITEFIDFEKAKEFV